MQLYFTPNIEQQQFLDADESKHLAKVLRKKVGDIFFSTDGCGNKFECKITDINPKQLKFELVQTSKKEKEKPEFNLLIAFTKNINRIEWMLEKCTEIGITSIQPILCEKSERKHFRKDRLERILIAATKQSQRFYVPKLFEIKKIEKAIVELRTKSNFIASYHKENIFLQDELKVGEDITILIGPEGDFTAKEINLVKENNFNCVNLSKARLRTETAALQACSIFNSINKK